MKTEVTYEHFQYLVSLSENRVFYDDGSEMIPNGNLTEILKENVLNQARKSQKRIPRSFFAPDLPFPG